jgi:CBS domain-containing protein
MAAPVPGLDLDSPPFDLLDAGQKQRLAAAVDLGYFAAGQRIIEAGDASPHVHVILKGLVQAFDGRGADSTKFADYGPGDLFGAFAVIAGRARHRYEAVQDTVCFLLPAAAFHALLADNPRFAAYFHEALSVKRRLLAEQQQPGELGRLMLTRVADAQLAPVHAVPAGTGIAAAAAALREHQVDCLLVAPGEGDTGEGIVTRTDLLDALTDGGLGRDAPVGPLASRPLLAVRADEVLFQALVSMTEHHVERVVVRDGDGRAIGTLGMAEVLAHYASSSHLISLRLARAQTVDDIAEAARGMADLVRQLHAQGAKMSYLMEMVSALNSRILARVFAQVVPAEFHDRLCLLVLGSEGRREQILKTDQDNALVLADGFGWDGLPAAMDAFSAALERIGYPPCAGRVMVNNPHWRLTVSQWRERIGQWARVADGQTALDLAITLDARPVAGNAALYPPLQPAMRELGKDAILLRYLAEAALSKGNPLTWLGQVRETGGRADLKRGGVFPLVHGLRTLALQHGIAHRNSFDRCAALVAAGAIDRELGRDVPQALAVLMRLRLGQQLADLDAGLPPGNGVDVAALRRLDRELLRDALRVVNAFKDHVQSVFHVGG